MMALRRREFQPAPMHDGRRVLPIEQALEWAYQTELCQFTDGVITEPGGGGWFGERVDGTRGGWDEAALARIVAPDAIAIHKRVEQLEQPGWLDVDLDPKTEDDPSRHEQFLQLFASTYVSLSAEAYFQDALPRAGNLVVVHARLGTVPDISGLPQPYAKRSANGEVMVQRQVELTQNTINGGKVTFTDDAPVRAGVSYAETRGKPTRGRYPQGSYCLVGYDPDWDEVMRERAEYLVWWLALSWLSDNLDGLSRIAVTPPELPMLPWQQSADS